MKLFNAFKQWMARAAIIGNQQGVAFLEFAFALPVLLFLTFATIEISNYIYANQKLQNAAYNVLNIINMQYNLTTGQLEIVSQIVPSVVEPLPLPDGSYVVYVTAMQKDPGVDAYVRWQYVYGPSTIGSSRFNFTEGAPPETNRVDPSSVQNYQFVDKDQLIAVEIYMFYEPLIKSDIIGGLFDMKGDYMYFFSTARPRKGAFQLDPDALSD